MSREILLHETARLDINDIADYIARDSLAAADRFVDAVGDAFERLAEMPGMGVRREFNNPRLAGMRMWPVTGFSKHLIFYRATETRLEVIRVLHGSRDLETLFASFEPEESSAGE